MYKNIKIMQLPIHLAEDKNLSLVFTGQENKQKNKHRKSKHTAYVIFSGNKHKKNGNFVLLCLQVK